MIYFLKEVGTTEVARDSLKMDVCGETCSKVRKTVLHRNCTEVCIFMRPGWKQL